VLDYFSGTTVVQVDKGGFQEPVPIPKATADVVNAAIGEAVEAGKVWLLSGPASLLAEPIPAGVLTAASTLSVPPATISVPEILPANLSEAWSGEQTNALAIATALSQRAGKTLPWKTIKYVIADSLQARFTQLAEESAPWPCDLPGAQTVKIKVAPAGPGGGTGGGGTGGGGAGGGQPKLLIASAQFEPSEIQDLADLIPQLLDFRAKAKIPIRFHVRLEVGDGTQKPSAEAAAELNKLIEGLKEGFSVV
jgi:hypothetical protein